SRHTRPDPCGRIRAAALEPALTHVESSPRRRGGANFRPMPSSSDGLDQIQRALDAIDHDDVAAARDALERASAILGETDPRVLHGRGIYAWAEGEIESASALLLEAADGAPKEARIYLDCAELLLD